MIHPRVTCEDVNKLVRMCSISHEKAITSLKQCSSSLFVLLYQRLFNCAIKGIESSPYTLEQKKWNVRCVLNELRDMRRIDVDGIDEEQIVQLNEEHISRLIALFLDIAERMSLQGGANLSHPPEDNNAASSVAVLPSFPAPRHKVAELPHESAEDGTWYDPVEQIYRRALPQHILFQDPMMTIKSMRREDMDGLLDVPPHEESVGEVFVVNEDLSEMIDQEVGESTGSYGNMEERVIPTSELVAVWSAQVIPPKPLYPTADSPALDDVRERLSIIDECLRAKGREMHQRRLRSSRLASQVAPARSSSYSGAGGHATGKPRRRVAPSTFLPGSIISDDVMDDTMLYGGRKTRIDYARRNEKIEMLRSVRFIDDLEREIGRKLVQRHSDVMVKLREEARRALQQDRQEMLERRRLIREEDQKYRDAYTAIITGASNDFRTAKGLMMEKLQQLAQLQAISLRESRRMCQYMKQESKKRVRHDLLRYASTVTEWQSHFS
ncbi:hypothetical protein ERJ75_000461700 [Trypanosoma vivax]|uniref:DUF5745 domain-containing protein n=1 Tax=Trypanosoma vivax (strain Y486) TaxID=1055687 RepID=G0U556_TRYVY|nr:hypothetical protein ERJ75_000461700 [Trypanosoma vivax]CCC51004.1 conserved hypothetical protein [Trypanosoma vivax Y486]